MCALMAEPSRGPEKQQTPITVFPIFPSDVASKQISVHTAMKHKTKPNSLQKVRKLENTILKKFERIPSPKAHRVSAL